MEGWLEGGEEGGRREDSSFCFQDRRVSFCSRYGSLQAPWLIMIVPGGNGGDTRLSVPFPARAAAAVASPARPPAAPNAAPSSAIIALCNKERDAGSKKGRRCPLSSCYIFLLPPLLYSPVIGPILPPPSFSSSCSVFPNVSPPNFSYAFSLNPRKKGEIESLFVPIFLFPFQVFWTIFFFPYSCGIFRSEIIFQDEKKNKNFYSKVFVQSCSIVEKIDNKKKIVEKFVYIVSM